MPERPRKRPADLNRLAASIVGDSTSEEPAMAAGVADHKWSLYEIAALLDSKLTHYR